ncbi:hypothetical protein BUE80_DR001586 [Diplocarpon rosae]|nr:hypothetical protein BUE80_DR001586 [Diplocarpon rosae]
MITLLPDDFQPLVVTGTDLVIASIAWGFTLGFGFLTTWTAIKQTAEVVQRYGCSKIHSPYIVMIWLEILVCSIFCVICWLHLNGNIPPSFAFFFVILTTWALQVQFLLQIIINRISLLLIDRDQAWRLKFGVAAFITAINISVYCIWIPARLQMSNGFMQINEVWDRCEKGLYLLVDAALNYYFIRIVKKSLVHQGLAKYDRLVRFNQWIVCLSLSMDCLIIGMMSLNNSFVYMQFHPVAYMVKLKIEMSMAELIVTVASDQNHQYTIGDASENLVEAQLTTAFGTSHDVNWRSQAAASGGDITFKARREVKITVERRRSADSSTMSYQGENFEKMSFDSAADDDREAERRQREAGEHMAGPKGGMGMTTKIWGQPGYRQKW